MDQLCVQSPKREQKKSQRVFIDEKKQKRKASGKAFVPFFFSFVSCLAIHFYFIFILLDLVCIDQ
jgi:hypothetical protein